MKFSLFLSVLVSFFLSPLSDCWAQPAPVETPPITDTASFSTEGGFQDLLLPISRYRCTPDGACLIEARGIYGGVEIGLRASIAGGMKEGMKGEEINEEAFLENGVELQSIGEPTRALAYALSQAYGMKFKSETLRETIGLTSIPLEGSPKKIESEPLKFKVFHDEKEEEGLYFELYINIDLKKKTFELAEKDEEYRQSILRTFLSQPKPKVKEKKTEIPPDSNGPLSPIQRLEKSLEKKLSPAEPTSLDGAKVKHSEGL